MHGYGDRLRGCREGLTVVIQGGVGNINPNVYLAICLRLSSSLLSSGLLGGSLISGGLIGGSLIGGSLIGSSLIGSSLISSSALGLGSSLGLIGGLRPIGSLAFR